MLLTEDSDLLLSPLPGLPKRATLFPNMVFNLDFSYVAIKAGSGAKTTSHSNPPPHQRTDE